MDESDVAGFTGEGDAVVVVLVDEFKELLIVGFIPLGGFVGFGSVSLRCHCCFMRVVRESKSEKWLRSRQSDVVMAEKVLAMI